jgi:hypothetical protein
MNRNSSKQIADLDWTSAGNVEFLNLKSETRNPKSVPFPFILNELEPIRPVVKQMFRFTHVYLDDKLLCSLRQSLKQPATNGMWLYTTTEHIESLAREFPDLPRRSLWRGKGKAWVVLASKLPGFEEYAFKACQLILQHDRRIGRLSRGKTAPRRTTILR